MSDRYVKDNSQLSNLSHQVESGGWAVLSELGNCRGEADWAGKLQLLFWIRWIRWACEPSPNMLILSVWMQQSLLSQEKLRFMIQDIRRPDPTEVPFLAGSPLEWGSLSLLLVFFDISDGWASWPFWVIWQIPTASSSETLWPPLGKIWRQASFGLEERVSGILTLR